MAYNEKMADRVREMIAAREDRVIEKLMFGGITFMVNDKICVGVKSDRILVRIAPDIYEKKVLGEGCIPMIHSGKEMKGFLFVAEEVIDTQSRLKHWVDLALEYNQQSFASGVKKHSGPKKTSAVKKTVAKTFAAKKSVAKKSVSGRKSASGRKSTTSKKATTTKKTATGKATTTKKVTAGKKASPPPHNA